MPPTPAGVTLSALVLFATLILPQAGRAQQTPPDPLDRLSLEQLMELEVQSVSRRDERLFDAPAAVYVLTANDLRRSGVAGVPEALSLVPGLYAGRINGAQWSVGSRGLGNLYANKLLVLIDGRSIYSRLFAGVLWEERNIPIDEIERIEVIRGPGATLWGANAVNGVINIVTKHSGVTSGFGLHARMGRDGEQEYGAQTAHQLGGGLTYRVFGSVKRSGALETPSGGRGLDDFDLFRAGLRADWVGVRDALEISGNLRTLDYGAYVSRPIQRPPFLELAQELSDFDGGSLQARWDRSLSSRSEISLAAYYDQADRTSGAFTMSERTADVELQHRLEAGTRNRLVWGLGFRTVAVDTREGFEVKLRASRAD